MGHHTHHSRRRKSERISDMVPLSQDPNWGDEVMVRDERERLEKLHVYGYGYISVLLLLCSITTVH